MPWLDLHFSWSFTETFLWIKRWKKSTNSGFGRSRFTIGCYVYINFSFTKKSCLSAEAQWVQLSSEPLCSADVMAQKKLCWARSEHPRSMLKGVFTIKHCEQRAHMHVLPLAFVQAANRNWLRGNRREGRREQRECCLHLPGDFSSLTDEAATKRCQNSPLYNTRCLQGFIFFMLELEFSCVMWWNSFWSREEAGLLDSLNCFVLFFFLKRSCVPDVV